MIKKIIFLLMIAAMPLMAFEVVEERNDNGDNLFSIEFERGDSGISVGKIGSGTKYQYILSVGVLSNQRFNVATVSVKMGLIPMVLKVQHLHEYYEHMVGMVLIDEKLINTMIRSRTSIVFELTSDTGAKRTIELSGSELQAFQSALTVLRVSN